MLILVPIIKNAELTRESLTDTVNKMEVFLSHETENLNNNECAEAP